jgi:hypothetical protein
LGKIIGICLNVPALAKPEKKKMMIIPVRNPLNSETSVGVRKNTVTRVPTAPM